MRLLKLIKFLGASKIIKFLLSPTGRSVAKGAYKTRKAVKRKRF
ncbi:hypothetical protein [Peptoniphilus sp. KCTC 25270]|nr:hypothetical protein [Peptoniphilus sp. KCTC 25270]